MVMCRKQITAVMLAVVIIFSGLNIGQLNIARAAVTKEGFTVTGFRYEGDSYGYSESVRTTGKIKKVTVNSVNQGSAAAEILDDYSFRVKFSGGSSYILTGGASATYEGTAVTDCTNDVAYIEVPVNKYVTEIIDIRFKGQGTSPKSSWEISHPDSNSSVIRFKAENGRYIPHYWYKTVTDIPASKVKDNTYLYTLPYTYTYYVENLSDQTKAALSSRVLSSYQLITKNGTVGTDKNNNPEQTLINDDPLKWGGAGWDIVYKLDGINGTKKLGNTNVRGNPYWNAVKIYYDPFTPNYDFKITMRLDRWEFLPVIEYKFQSKQYDYSADVTVEYEDIAGPQAYFTAPAEVGVSETFTIVEDSKTPEGTTITGWTWEISTDGGGSWSSLSWGHGTFTGSFNSEGERLVRLKVENDAGQVSDWFQRSISVMNNSPNQPPVSRFDIESPVYVGFDAWIRDRSYDPDGTIVDVDYDSDCPDYGLGRDDDGDRVMRFYVPGEFTVILEVEDDRGATASSSQGVKVLPVPEADIDVSGRLRVNRKVVLSSLKSVASPDDPIDHTKDNWTITPVNPPVGLEYHVVDSGTPGVKWLQSNMACDFRVELVVRTQGGATDDASITVHIEPDTPPVVNIMVKPQAIRDPENGTKAVILPVCDTRVQEGDYISSRTWYYKYDTDNDGSFSDEAWIMFSSGNNPSPIFETASRGDVGKYLFRLDVEENWRDEYIPAYVTADDFLTDNNLDTHEADRTVEVLNIPPIFSFTPIRVQKADVLLLVQEEDRIAMENKETALEAQLRNGDIAPIDPEIAVDTFVGGTAPVKMIWDDLQYEPSNRVDNLMQTENTAVFEVREEYGVDKYRLIGRRFSDGAVVYDYSDLQYSWSVFDEVGVIYLRNNNTGAYSRINPDTGIVMCTFPRLYISSKSVSDKYVISKYNDYYIYDNKTGALIDRIPESSRPQIYYIDDNFVYFVDYINSTYKLYIYDLSGRVLSTDLPGFNTKNVSNNFDSDDDYVYLSCDKTILCINKSDGDIKWSYTDPDTEFYSPDRGIWLNWQKAANRILAVGNTVFFTISFNTEYRDHDFYRTRIIAIDKDSGGITYRGVVYEMLEYYSSGADFYVFDLYEIKDNKILVIDTDGYYLLGKTYNRNGYLGSISYSDAGYFGFLNNDRSIYYVMDSDITPVYLYDLDNNCSLINTIDLDTYSERKRGHVIQIQNYSDASKGRMFTWSLATETKYESKLTDINTDNQYFSFMKSAQYNFIYELVGGKYLVAQDYNAGLDALIYDIAAPDTPESVIMGWRDDILLSADNKYLMTVLETGTKHYAYGYKITKLFYEAVEKIKNAPQREAAARYITFFTKGEIPYDEFQVQLLLKEIYKVDGKVVFFGSSANEAIGRKLADATGGIFMTYADYDDALAKLDNYIKNRAAAEIEKESEIALLLDEEYILETDCYDYEDDTIIAEEWLYEHDPDYFENGLGLASYHLVPQSVPRTKFEHTGLFKTTARVQDQPKADARFSNYWLWSLDTDPLWLYVHRRPVADVEIHAKNLQDELGDNKFKRGAPLVLINDSYDPDAQSRPDRGIVNTKIEYKKLTDTEFTTLYNYSSFTIAETGQYVFRISVDDYYGVWSEPQYIFVEITDQSSSVFSIMATVESEKPDFTPANIPASENLLLTDITTVCNYAVTKVDVQLYTTGGAPAATLLTLNNPADINSISGNTTYWLDKTYTIQATCPDGNYIMRFVATNTQGHTASLGVPVRVNTPVTIDAYIDGGKGGGEYNAGDVLNLTAYTNAYTSGVKVNIAGDWYNLILIKDDGYVKTWGIVLEIPSTLGSGNTDIVFTAAAYNGKTATEVLEITVRALSIEDFEIAHMVNHPIHDGKFPIAWNSPEVPVKYKAGYYITFKTRVKGDPDRVKLRISYSNYMFSYDEEFDMVKEYEDEEGGIWVLRWYADSDKRKTPKGTIINTRLRAIKDGSEFDFNAEESWNGDFIEVYTSAEGDFRIDQVYSE